MSVKEPGKIHRVTQNCDYRLRKTKFGLIKCLYVVLVRCISNWLDYSLLPSIYPLQTMLELGGTERHLQSCFIVTSKEQVLEIPLRLNLTNQPHFERQN